MLQQLRKYDLSFIHKKGKELYLADTLSRSNVTENTEETIFEYEVKTDLPVSPTRLAVWNAVLLACRTMIKLATFTTDGWACTPMIITARVWTALRFKRQTLGENDIVMKGQKVVLPKNLRSTYTEVLHKGHPGADLKNKDKQQTNKQTTTTTNPGCGRAVQGKCRPRQRLGSFLMSRMRQLQSPVAETALYCPPSPIPSMVHC